MVSWLCGIEGAATRAEGHSARKRKGSWSQPSEREREVERRPEGSGLAHTRGRHRSHMPAQGFTLLGSSDLSRWMGN
jgi:hypothetical protein